MDAAAQYSDDGYIIIRSGVSMSQIMELQGLVAAVEQDKRKVPLLDNPAMVAIVDTIVMPVFTNIDVQTSSLVELYLLVAKGTHVVKLGWHRDAKVSDANVGDGVHSFQLPLLPGDNIHQVVPGTHRREINADEIAARNAGGNAMPNAVRIDLAVGDLLLRSPFLFHRGYGLAPVERLTLVGTYADPTLQASGV